MQEGPDRKIKRPGWSDFMVIHTSLVDALP